MASAANVIDRKEAMQLDAELLPGTELMKDAEGVRYVRAGGSERCLVLVPHPTDSPSDPLNWSPLWKYATAISQLLYVWALVCSGLSLAPAFPLLADEFHIDNQQLSLLTGVNVIALGFANILLVPLSNIFGRRPIAIFCGALVVLTNVWQALATSYSSLLASRACNGLVAATSETIMVQVVADIFFLHERGFWMGAYFFFHFCGAFLGPIITGNIAARHGFRSFFWLTVALAGFGTILLIVLFPETRWRRESINHAGVKDDTNAALSSLSGAQVRRGRPSRSQFSPVQKPSGDWSKVMIRDITTPVIVFFNPIVFWAGLMLTGPADLLLLFNLTESALLGSPAYGWSPSSVGYSNFAFFVGGLVGLATAGPLSDWLAHRATLKNNGIREAEMRLPALIPFVVFFIISHVVGAIGYQRLWPWQAIIICGFGFSGLAVASIPAISIAYAVDCYMPIAGEIMVVATVLKNVLGFCLSYWIFNVAAGDGYVAVYMTQFAVDMLPVVFTVPLYIWGKKLRRWTRKSDFHRREALF